VNDHRPDDNLAELLSDAVADVEPTHRLGAIRERTRAPATSPRRRWLVVGSAVVASAAAVTAVAVVGDLWRDSSPGPDPAGTPPGAHQAVPAYFAGSLSRGPRLFREFVNTDASTPEIEATLDALEGPPGDPDYSTYWTTDSFAGGFVESKVIYVELADVSLRERPAGLTGEEAALAIEQVIFSVQGAAGARLPVQFRFEDNPIDQVYGRPTSEPLANSPVTDVLSLMSITTPAEGMEVSGSFVAQGVNNGFEATYQWQIRRGDETVLDGFGMAEGWMGERLFPWRTPPIDVSALEPGEYTFIATNDDPSGGTEGGGPDSDTRTIVVR